ncbi:FecCD family ABC transporter permease [Alteromonas sp. H39]|uniref:FecCD family ABC transporter permease n=1 Tax=Alteromonas sp. H39 TaxID=3389876 RepID=UPI0039DFBD54
MSTVTAPAQTYHHFIQARVRQRKLRTVLITVALLAAMYAGLVSGSYEIQFVRVMASMFAAPLSSDMATQYYIVTELRLPRVLMTAMVGAMLAMSGCAMQGLVRNPLADPGLIGIAGGAAAAAAVSMAVLPPFIPALASVWVAAWAFGGALLAVWLVVRFASTPGGMSVASLILAGVAINALSGTIIGAVSYVASDDALRQITYWTMGSMAGAQWQVVGVIVAAGVLATAGLMACRQALNLLALGESDAAYMGLNVTRYKQAILWLVAFSVAIATALCGIISFVGLVVPHICRSLFGVEHRFLLPVCGLMGALLLVIADTLSRALFPPMEIPIGIVTSAIGAPFFLYLLWQQKGRLGFV